MNPNLRVAASDFFRCLMSGHQVRKDHQKLVHRNLNEQRRPHSHFSVDDHPLLREGIGMIINNQPDMVLVAQRASSKDAIEQFRKVKPTSQLMDCDYRTGMH